LGTWGSGVGLAAAFERNKIVKPGKRLRSFFRRSMRTAPPTRMLLIMRWQFMSANESGAERPPGT
jgi:hypothetical protein